MQSCDDSNVLVIMVDISCRVQLHGLIYMQLQYSRTPYTHFIVIMDQQKRQACSYRLTAHVGFSEKEASKIDNILDKFQSRSKKSTSRCLFLQDQNTTKNESLQISSIPTQNEEKLKLQISELQNELQVKIALIADYQAKLNEAVTRIEETELKLQLAEQKFMDLKPTRESIKVDYALAESQKKYRQLYQQAQLQLQELRNTVQGNLKFQQHYRFHPPQQVQAIDESPQFQHQNPTQFQHYRSHDLQKYRHTDTEHYKHSEQQELKANTNQGLSQKMEELERENIELQNKVAEMSHNVAQLFNAAYEYGGAKLLDFLQRSIGLTELED